MPKTVKSVTKKLDDRKFEVSQELLQLSILIKISASNLRKLNNPAGREHARQLRDAALTVKEWAGSLLAESKVVKKSSCRCG